MPYERHPVMPTPPDALRIWRFMDFAKFLALLESHTLHFAPIAAFDDPLEGFLTSAASTRVHRTKVRDGSSGMPLDLKAIRQALFASCWHSNEHESAALWKLHLKSNAGLCVQSTVGRMKTALARFEKRVVLAEVRYLDYEREEMDWDFVEYYAIYKRENLEHEREFRAIIHDASIAAGSGVAAPVDLGALIDAVFIAPGSPPWIRELTTRLLQRYGVATEVRQSALDCRPLY